MKHEKKTPWLPTNTCKAPVYGDGDKQCMGYMPLGGQDPGSGHLMTSTLKTKMQDCIQKQSIYCFIYSYTFFIV